MVKQGLGSALAHIMGRTLRHVRRREPGASPRPPAPPEASSARVGGSAYPGDFRGTPEISYEPNPANSQVADPGEIVWTWVPFEEDHSQGKDRPVLVIGRDGRWLLALQLTSRDHDRDTASQAGSGRRWTDIGSGPWDTRGRDSEARIDRILRVDPAGVRRIGAVLDEGRFNQVATALRRPTP